MRTNKFLEKLLNMRVGGKLEVKNKNTESEGTFLRVPSGWIYRYVSRALVTACFIPYAEDIKQWDVNLEIHSCSSCKSADVVLSNVKERPIDVDDWEVVCQSCNASSGKKKNQIDALVAWRRMNRKH